MAFALEVMKETPQVLDSEIGLELIEKTEGVMG